MTRIFRANCAATNFTTLVKDYSFLLPYRCKQAMQAFRLEKDAHRYLLGKILLLKGVSWMSYPDVRLADLKFTSFNKPYFDNCLQFNISHSGEYVLCAISDDSRIGIDVEEVKEINKQDMQQCFTQNEWDCINESTESTDVFYKFWTRKEAVIKADGRGLHIPLLSFEVISDSVTIGENKWYIQEVTMSAGYQAHLVSDHDMKDNCSIIELL